MGYGDDPLTNECTFCWGYRSPDAALPYFRAVKPDYLADLRDVTAVEKTVDLDFEGGGGTCTVNGNAFVSGTDSVDHTLEIGKVYDYSLTGTNGHPFHLHVNSFQIISVRPSLRHHGCAGAAPKVLNRRTVAVSEFLSIPHNDV